MSLVQPLLTIWSLHLPVNRCLVWTFEESYYPGNAIDLSAFKFAQASKPYKKSHSGNVCLHITRKDCSEISAMLLTWKILYWHSVFSTWHINHWHQRPLYNSFPLYLCLGVHKQPPKLLFTEMDSILSLGEIEKYVNWNKINHHMDAKDTTHVNVKNKCASQFWLQPLSEGFQY